MSADWGDGTCMSASARYTADPITIKASSDVVKYCYTIVIMQDSQLSSISGTFYHRPTEYNHAACYSN